SRVKRSASAFAENRRSALCADRAAILSLNLEISARLDVIRPRLELFDAHLSQKPAALDFLRGYYLKAFDQFRVPVVSLHAHQCAARLVHPEPHALIRRLTRR